MSAPKEISDVWAAPPLDAPPLHHKAHRFLLDILMQIHPTVPEILDRPQEVLPARILDSAIAVLMEDEALNGDLRDAVYDLLQRRLSTINRTPQRLILPCSSQFNPIPESFSQQLAFRMSAIEATECFVLKRKVEFGLKESQSTLLTLLFIRVIVQMGHCSKHVLAILLENLGRPLHVAGQWIYLDIELPETLERSSERRRIFFDPATAGLWASLNLPERSSEQKLAERRRGALKFLDQVLLECFESMDLPAMKSPLLRLIEAQETYLRIHSLPVIATYSKGGLVASSLTEDTWLRPMGYRPPKDGGQSDPGSGEELMLGISYTPSESPTIREQVESGEFDETGLIAQLRNTINGQRAEWPTSFQRLVDEHPIGNGKTSAEALLVRWLLHLATKKKSKGRPLADGTVKQYFSLLANRLLTVAKAPFDEIDSEDLEQYYMDITGLAASSKQRGQVMVVLRKFDSFVRTNVLTTLPMVALRGFEGMRSEVSARTITEDEYLQALALAGSERLAIKPTELRQQTIIFFILGFRCGLRRSEILGLAVSDFHWDEPAALIVQEKSYRSIKTDNAKRKIPLSLLPRDERDLLHSFVKSREASGFLFFDVVPTKKDLENHAAVRWINLTLERVTGDKNLHPHSLRHAFATWALLGMLGPDVGLNEHMGFPEQLKVSMKSGARVHNATAGALHRLSGRGSALAVLMGHSSELTTYEHYVHCFDLLLFISSTRNLMAQTSGIDSNYRALVMACNRYHATTRRALNSWQDMAELLLQRNPERAIACPVAEGRSTPEVFTVESVLTLDDLRSTMTERIDSRGEPTKQTERDTAHMFMDAVRGWTRQDAVATQRLLALFVDHQLKGSDWASVNRNDLQETETMLRKLGEREDAVEVMHVWTPRGKSNNKKMPVRLGAVTASSWDKEGRYWLRFKDRRRQAEIERQRTQASLTWVAIRLVKNIS